MREKIKRIITNKKINALVVSILIYMSLCLQKVIVPYNLLSILMMVLIYNVIIKNNLNTSYKKEIGIISTLFSIMLIVGKILYVYRYDPTVSFLNEFFKLKSILFFIGNYSIFYIVLSLIIPRVINNKYIKDTKKIKNIFFISFISLMFVYLIFYIIYFPGILSSDSTSEIDMILGNIPLSDHHTIFHILWMSGIYNIVKIFTNNINIIVGAITFFQMTVMSLIISYAISFLHKRGTPRIIILIMILYYVLLPVNGFYSITVWKDIIFSCNVLLLTIECIKLLEKKNNITFKNSWTFIIVSMLTVFSRNNAIYMYLLLSMLILFIFNKNRITLLSMILIVFCSYYIVKGPIYKLYNIESPRSSEYIAIPLQQIGRMAYKDVEFTTEEKELIDKLIPVETLKKVYCPEIVDSIKFNEKFNNKVFEENKIDYLTLWIKLCLKHPATAVEAYLTSVLGYWYPGTEYWVTTADIYENSIGIHNSSFVPKYIRDKVTKIMSTEAPIFGYTNCIGLCFWILLIMLFITVKKLKKYSWFIYTPVLGIWLTMFIATPVFSEFRYIYCAYLCLPVFLAYIYSNNIKYVDNNK